MLCLKLSPDIQIKLSLTCTSLTQMKWFYGETLDKGNVMLACCTMGLHQASVELYHISAKGTCVIKFYIANETGTNPLNNILIIVEYF